MFCAPKPTGLPTARLPSAVVPPTIAGQALGPGPPYRQLYRRSATSVMGANAHRKAVGGTRRCCDAPTRSGAPSAGWRAQGESRCRCRRRSQPRRRQRLRVRAELRSRHAGRRRRGCLWRGRWQPRRRRARAEPERPERRQPSITANGHVRSRPTRHGPGSAGDLVGVEATAQPALTAQGDLIDPLAASLRMPRFFRTDDVPGRRQEEHGQRVVRAQGAARAAGGGQG